MVGFGGSQSWIRVQQRSGSDLACLAGGVGVGVGVWVRSDPNKDGRRTMRVTSKLSGIARYDTFSLSGARILGLVVGGGIRDKHTSPPYELYLVGYHRWLASRLLQPQWPHAFLTTRDHCSTSLLRHVLTPMTRSNMDVKGRTGGLEDWRAGGLVDWWTGARMMRCSCEDVSCR